MGNTSSRGEMVFEIYRHSDEGGFLSRVCKDKATDEVKYFCKVDNKTLDITIYKGGYSGTVIATAVQNREKGGITKIKMTDEALHMKHGHGLLESDKTFFETHGKRVHWTGESKLTEDETNIILATYKPKNWETNDRKLGTLVIMPEGAEYVDAIVSSALVKQERTDEWEFEKLVYGKANATTTIMYLPG